jgi:hypothetical protein
VDDEAGEGRGAFEHFAERATDLVSGALLVALLQNSQRRSSRALHDKLDAIADGLADLMEHQIDRDPGDLTTDIDELKAAVGLQHKR